MCLTTSTYSKRNSLIAIIQEFNLFSWKDFQNDLQNLGDLERLKLVIENLPDAKLMHTFRVLRGRGRNDNPIAAMWNSLLAGIVFEHVSVESLRRELSRNAQLREMCGFNPIPGVDAVPSKSAYNRSLSSLIKHARSKSFLLAHAPKRSQFLLLKAAEINFLALLCIRIFCL